MILINTCTKVKESFQTSQLMLLLGTPYLFSLHLLHTHHVFPTRSPNSNPQQGTSGALGRRLEKNKEKLNFIRNCQLQDGLHDILQRHEC